MEASSAVVNIQLGKRNVKEFVKRYKKNDDYIFIKMFSKSIFSKTKYDGCIVYGCRWEGSVKKLVLFVYHPEGSMHCVDVKAAERCDDT